MGQLGTPTSGGVRAGPRRGDGIAVRWGRSQPSSPYRETPYGSRIPARNGRVISAFGVYRVPAPRWRWSAGWTPWIQYRNRRNLPDANHRRPCRIS